MTTPARFRGRLIGGALIDQHPRVAGALVELEAAAVAELVLDGNGLLHDPADLRRLHAVLAACGQWPAAGGAPCKTMH